MKGAGKGLAILPVAHHNRQGGPMSVGKGAHSWTHTCMRWDRSDTVLSARSYAGYMNVRLRRRALSLHTASMPEEFCKTLDGTAHSAQLTTAPCTAHREGQRCSGAQTKDTIGKEGAAKHTALRAPTTSGTQHPHPHS